MSDDSAGDTPPTALAATIAQRDRGASESGDVPVMVERFVIEDILGAGGMGRVYVAYDPTLDRRVALKVLRGRLVDVDKAHARMAREARAMARLRHPNVVTVHEVGTHQGGVFIVMEYVEGGTLRDWLDRTPDADWQQIVAMYLSAGRGLAAAHAAGLVHRDFKPDNVLVGEDGRVLVGDFGIANVYGDDDDEPITEPPDGAAKPRLTRAGSVIGTPPYMAPEQHRGQAVDARTDQFAFCVSLYEALYGTRPFVGTTQGEIAERAIRGEIAAPTRERDVPARVREAIVRGLSCEPAQRFATMDALLDQLRVERRSPARWIAAGVAVAALAAFAIWWTTREPPAEAPPPAPPIGLVGVESFQLDLKTYPRIPEWREAFGDLVALLLADIDGFKVVGPSQLLGDEGMRDARDSAARPDFRAAEARAGAAIIARGSAEEQHERVHVRIELLHPDGTRIAIIERERPIVELAEVASDAVDGVAEALAPGKRLPRGDARNRARALHAIGAEHLRNNNFQLALLYLEQAVIADASFFEGWYALALTRGWVLAPEPRVYAALEAARATAPSEVKRKLVDGAGRYLHHDLAAARAVLEPLVADPALSKQEQRDALYLLGEAHWHDGHHRIGVGFFRRALDLDMRFKLPVQHLGEYASANRDLPMMQQYSAMTITSMRDFRDLEQFVKGNYEELVRSGTPAWHMYGLIMLDRPVPPDLEAAVATIPIDIQLDRAAIAFGRGDRAAARRAVDQLWEIVQARERAGELGTMYYELQLLADTVLCAGDRDEIRRLVTFLADHSRERPVRNYQRASILAAPIVGERAWIIRDHLTDRERQIADAITAEMDGDHTKAVALLEPLVRDPAPSWDFPERVALLRNLRALNRTAEARALCDDTLRPAMFQWAFPAARRACLSVPPAR